MFPIDTSSCWYQASVVNEMNRFYDQHRNNMEIQKHLYSVVQLLNLTDENGNELLDLGCGTAFLSEFCKEYKYSGADMFGCHLV